MKAAKTPKYLKEALYPTKKAFNPLCANFTKWSNTLKQFVGKLPMNCLSVFGHFVGLVLKGLSLSATHKATHMQRLFYVIPKRCELICFFLRRVLTS